MAPARWRSRLLASLASTSACYAKCALDAGLLFATAALAGQVAAGSALTGGGSVWDHADALVAAVVGAGLALDAAAGVPLADASPLDALALATAVASACVGAYASGWAALVPGRACLLQITWAGLLCALLEGALGFRQEALQTVAASAAAAASYKAAAGASTDVGLTPRGASLSKRRGEVTGGDATPPPPAAVDGSPAGGAGSRRRVSLPASSPGGALVSPRHARRSSLSSSTASPSLLPAALLPSMGSEVRGALTLLLRCLVALLVIVPAVLRACVDAGGLVPSSAGLIATAVIATLAAAAALVVLRRRLHARVITPLHRLAAFIHLLGQGQGAQAVDATAAAGGGASAQPRGAAAAASGLAPAGASAGSDVEKGSAESGGSGGRGQQRSLWVSLFRRRRQPGTVPSGGSVAAGSASASHEGPPAAGDVAAVVVGCASGAACAPPSFGAFPSPFAAATWAADAEASTAEVELLRHYFRRMWRLVQLGFGEAGHAIVARYISSDDAVGGVGAGPDGLPLLLPQLSVGTAAGRRASFGSAAAAAAGGRPPSARRRPQQLPSTPPAAAVANVGGATRGALRHSTAFAPHSGTEQPQSAAAPPVDTTASIVGIAHQPPTTSVTDDGRGGGLRPLHPGGFSPAQPGEPVPPLGGGFRGPPLRFDSVLDAPSLLTAAAAAAAAGVSAAAAAPGGGGGGGGFLRGLRGEKVHAVFMFADLFSFTAITEALQEDVLAFVNEVARIVHAEVDAGGGAPNKNIGDAFLCTWKLPDAPLRNTVKTRRRSAGGGGGGALAASAALAAGGASLPSTGSSGGGGWAGAGLLRSLRRGSLAFSGGSSGGGTGGGGVSGGGGTPHQPTPVGPHAGGLVGAPDLALADAAAASPSSAALPSTGSSGATGPDATKRRSSRLSLALASPGSVLQTFFRHGRAGSTASVSSAGGGGGDSSVGGSPALGATTAGGGGAVPLQPLSGPSTHRATPSAAGGDTARSSHDASDDPVALRASAASRTADSASPPAQHSSREGSVGSPGSPDAATGSGGGAVGLSLYVSPALVPLPHATSAAGLPLLPLPSITEVSHSTETPVVAGSAVATAAAMQHRSGDGSGDSVPPSVAVATDASLHLSLSPGALSSPLPPGRAYRSLSLPAGGARHAHGGSPAGSSTYISAVSTADGRSGTLTAPLSTLHATSVGGLFLAGGGGSGGLYGVAESATGVSSDGSSGDSSPSGVDGGSNVAAPLMVVALPSRSPATPPHAATAGPPLLLAAGSPPLSFRGPFPLPTNAGGGALQMSPRLRAYSSSFGGGGETGLMLPVASPPHGSVGIGGSIGADPLADSTAGALLSGGFPHVLEPLEDEEDAPAAAMSPTSSQNTQNAASTYGGRGTGHAGSGSSRPPLPASFHAHFPAATSGEGEFAGASSGTGAAAASMSSSAPSSPTAVPPSRRQQPRRFATAAGAALAGVTDAGYGGGSDATAASASGSHAFHLSHSVSEGSLLGGTLEAAAAGGSVVVGGGGGGGHSSTDSVGTVTSSRYVLSVSGGSRPSTAPAAMPHHGTAQAWESERAAEGSSGVAAAESAGSPVAECESTGGRDTRSTVASEQPQQVTLPASDGADGLHRQSLSDAASSSTSTSESRTAVDDGGDGGFSRGTASRHSASSTTAEAGIEGTAAAPAPALLPVSPLGPHQLADTVSPLSSGGVPTPPAAATPAAGPAALRRGDSGDSYSGVTSLESSSRSHSNGNSGSGSSASASGVGAPVPPVDGAASHAPTLPSVLSSSSLASTGSGAYSSATGDLGSYASSGDTAAAAAAAAGGAGTAAGASGTIGSTFSSGSSAEASGGAPAQAAAVTAASHAGGSAAPPLMVPVPSVTSLITFGGGSGAGGHGLSRPPPVPTEPVSHAASRRTSRLGSLGTPSVLAPLTTSGLPSPALASAHSSNSRRESLALPPPAPHPASGVGAPPQPLPSITSSLPLASALGPSRRASFGFSGGPAAALPPGLAPLSAPAASHTPPFPLLSSPATSAASPHLTAHILAHAQSHQSQQQQQLAHRKYRRASSVVSLYAQPGLNPYTQRVDISRIADNALAAAVNIALRVHAANLPGGSLHPYLLPDRLAARAGSVASNSGSGSAPPQPTSSTPSPHANATGGGSGGALSHFRLGLGLHIGWAIEGAIGSSLKMDATYLSPSVNITARLESATRVYGVDVLVSQAFAECLSEPAQNLLRLIDRVQLKGVGSPFHVYTIDWDADAGLALLEGRAAAAAAHDDGGADSGGVRHPRTQRRRRRLSDFDGYADGGADGGDGVGAADDDELYIGGVRYRAIPGANGSGGGGVAGDGSDGDASSDDGDDGEALPAGDGDAVAVNVHSGSGGGGAPLTLSPLSVDGSSQPRSASQRPAQLRSQHSHRRAAGGTAAGVAGSRRRRRRSATIVDLAALQPSTAFPADFFEHAELAVSFYLGDPYCDWARARAHAEAALALRPGDGPLRSLLRFTGEQGVGPTKAAPPWWRGYRSLESK